MRNSYSLGSVRIREVGDLGAPIRPRRTVGTGGLVVGSAEGAEAAAGNTLPTWALLCSALRFRLGAGVRGSLPDEQDGASRVHDVVSGRIDQDLVAFVEEVLSSCQAGVDDPAPPHAGRQGGEANDLPPVGGT